jgi:phosphonate transport system substrate-binding protein
VVKKLILVKLLAVFALLVFLSGCHSKALVTKKILKLTILPEASMHMMTQRFVPLIDYLSKETNYQFDFVSSLGYSDFLSSLESSKADFSFQNPYIYAILAKTRGAYPIAEALTTEGKESSCGVIITHWDSPVNTLEDIRGKNIMISARKSFFGYIAPCLLCREYNIDVEKDCKIIQGGKNDLVVFNVFKRKVEVGFVREDALYGAKDLVDISKIKIIARTEEFPYWCLTAFPETPQEAVAQVKAALFKLNPENPEYKKILESAQLGGFLEAEPAKFQIIRQSLDTLGIPY